MVPWESNLAKRPQGVEIMQRAEEVRTAFRDLSSLVCSTQDRLGEIAHRGFFGRMFANNTRDLALAMQDVVKMQAVTVQLVRVALAANARSLAMTQMIHSELEAFRQTVGGAIETQSGQADRLLQVQGTVDQMLLLAEQQMLMHEERERSSQEIERLRRTMTQRESVHDQQAKELARLRRAMELAAPQLMGVRPMTTAKVLALASAVGIAASVLVLEVYIAVGVR
ncbi:MAG: hypothetical protein R3A52_02225 [Polyangiales bacterium]